MIKGAVTLGVGVALGVWVRGEVDRRVAQAQAAVRPTALAHRAGRAAGSVAGTAGQQAGQVVGVFARAARDGRAAAARREAELRATFDVPAPADAAR